MSIARKHFLRCQAQEQAKQVSEYGSMQDLTAYELQLVQLNNDRIRLKNMQSDKLRAEFKTQQLPQYLPYVQGILQARPNVPDDIVTEMMVWAVDIGDFGTTLDIAEYVLSANLPMPDRFGRNVASFITEDVADDVLKRLQMPEAPNLPVVLSDLERLLEIISNNKLPASTTDMPDQVKAKLHLALGRVYMTQENYTSAKEHLQSALSLHEHCGAKTNLKQVLKHLSQSQDGMPS